MVCDKCGYKDKKEIKIGTFSFCKICATFAPTEKTLLKKYVSDKVDWKILDCFREYGEFPGSKHKQGMEVVAKKGKIVSRPPFGYSLLYGELEPNKDFPRISKIFSLYLNANSSFNKFAHSLSLSFNSLKNILTNRTYLGEVKFNSVYYKASHRPAVSPEIFYAVQRKLKKEGLLK